MSVKKRISLGLLIFAVVAGFWFLRMRDYELLRMDDAPYVIENDFVRDGLTGRGLAWAFSSFGREDNWHPMTWLSLMADAELAPRDDLQALSRVMHAHSAFVQGLCAALLFLLILRLSGGAGRGEFLIPALLTLAWALHPLRAESVCWMAERKELLCTLYSLLAILAWTGDFRFRRAVAVLALALALLSKSVAVTLPVVLMGVDFFRADDWRVALRKNWASYALMLVLCAGTVLLTFMTQTQALEGNQDPATLHIRLANGCGAYAIHLFRTVWPAGLYFYRQFTDCVDWTAFLPGLVLCGAMEWTAAAYLVRRPKAGSGLSLAFLAVAWIGVGLGPMCGVLRVGIEMNPDRFGHWIGVGLTAVVAVALVRHLPGRARLVSAAVLVPLTVAAAVAGWTYAANFRNNFDLFARTLRYEPNHPAAYAQLGFEYLTRFRDRDKAIDCYERSIALRKDDDNGAILATLLASRKRPEDFRRILEVCRAVDVDHSLDERGGALTALGIVHMHAQEWDAAIGCFRDAIERQKRDKKLRGDRTPVEENTLRIAMCHCNARRLAAARPYVDSLKAASQEKVRLQAQRMDAYLSGRGF